MGPSTKFADEEAFLKKLHAIGNGLPYDTQPEDGQQAGSIGAAAGSGGGGSLVESERTRGLLDLGRLLDLLDGRHERARRRVFLLLFLEDDRARGGARL